MGGSKQPPVTTNVSKSEPWDAAKPFYENMYAMASQALAGTNKNPFGGDFIATDQDSGGYIGKGITELRRNVADLGAGEGATRQLGLDTVSGKYLDPNTNPFIKAAAEAAVRPVEERLREGALPSIRDQSIAQGAYGGGRQDVQENEAVQEFQRDALDRTNQMYYTNYAAERDRMAGGVDILNAADDMGRAKGLELLRIGDVAKNRRQENLDNNYKRFMERKNANWYGLGEMAQILGTGGFRTTTGESTGPRQDSTGQWIQAGVGGTAAAASLLKVLPALFAMSDETEKTDIKKVSEGVLGVPVYSYRYKGDPKTYPKVIGPMAQDIEKVVPEAVWEVGGKKVVSAPVLKWFAEAA